MPFKKFITFFTRVSWKYYLGGLITVIIPALLTAIIPLLWPKEIPPRFFLKTPHIHPRDSLIIIAENKPAMQAKPLNVEFEGLKFIEAGKLIPSSQNKRWYFSLNNPQIPSVFLRDGTHTIKVGFKGEPFSDKLEVYFNTNLQYTETVTSVVNDTSIEASITSKPVINQFAEKATLVFSHVQQPFDIGPRIAISRDIFFEANGKVVSVCYGGRYWFCFVEKDRVWPQDYLEHTERVFNKEFAIPAKFNKGKIVLACVSQRLHKKYYDWNFGQVTSTDHPVLKPNASEFKIVMETIILTLD